jgi:hypothetical protein
VHEALSATRPQDEDLVKVMLRVFREACWGSTTGGAAEHEALSATQLRDENLVTRESDAAGHEGAACMKRASGSAAVPQRHEAMSATCVSTQSQDEDLVKAMLPVLRERPAGEAAVQQCTKQCQQRAC